MAPSDSPGNSPADYPEIASYIASLRPYVPGKPIEETQAQYHLKKVIKLASNENPLGPSPKAMAAIRARLKELHRYPDAAGAKLKAVLSKKFKVPVDEIILGNGSNDIIEYLIRAYCVPGDAIVTSKAAFIAYSISAQIQGVRTLEAPLLPGMRFDLKAMLELVRKDARAKIVFLPNPNNPTGTYVPETELREFLNAIAQIRGGRVIVALDDAYGEYVTAKDFPDGLKIYREFTNVVLMRTFSKVYGLGGLRVGYGLARPAVIQVLDRVRQPFHVSELALVGAAAALGDVAFVRRSQLVNRAGLKQWSAALNRLDIPFVPTQGNFLLIDVEAGLGLSGVDVATRALEMGMIFRPVANYGLHGHLRVSVGTAAENARAIRLLQAIQKTGPHNA